MKSKKIMTISMTLAICTAVVAPSIANAEVGLSGMQESAIASTGVGMTGMTAYAKTSHATYAIINNQVVKTNKVYPQGGKYIVQTSPKVGYVTIKDAYIPNTFYLLTTTDVSHDLGYY
ncbi:hypothetical protein [Gottfriedia acidiceleris]|uniref:hypothetical protein n=1 Tax=Gottfriedia acidiceleris TaxID=371036 RepID=UPI003000545F